MNGATLERALPKEERPPVTALCVPEPLPPKHRPMITTGSDGENTCSLPTICGLLMQSVNSTGVARLAEPIAWPLVTALVVLPRGPITITTTWKASIARY